MPTDKCKNCVYLTFYNSLGFEKEEWASRGVKGRVLVQVVWLPLTDVLKVTLLFLTWLLHTPFHTTTTLVKIYQIK